MPKKRRIKNEEGFPEAVSAEEATGLMAAPAKTGAEWDSYLSLQSLMTDNDGEDGDIPTDAL